MAEPISTYIGHLLQMTGRTAFAFAASAMTFLLIPSMPSMDTSLLLIVYAGLFGAWWLVAYFCISRYRWVTSYWRNRPDYALLKTQERFIFGDAAHLLSGIKTTAQGTHDSEAWLEALMNIVESKRVAFVDDGFPRVGRRPHSTSVIGRRELASAVRHLGKRVPRWLR